MLLAWLLLLVTSTPSVPQPAPPPSRVRLSWSSIEGCPDGASIAQRVEDLLGPRPGSQPVDVVTRIERSAGGFRLHLRIAAPDGLETRELEAADCELLSHAGVLVIAVTVDAVATATHLTPPEPEVASTIAAPSVPARRSSKPLERATEPNHAEIEPSLDAAESRPNIARPWTHGLRIAVRGGAAIAATPGVTGGFETEVAWRIGPVGLAIGGAHWIARVEPLLPDARIRAALSVATMRGCWAATRARFEVPLCAGLELGAMHGGGRGAAVRPQPVRELWVGVAAGGGVLYWAARRFGLDVRVDAVIAARRPAMYLDLRGNAQEVFRMAPLGARIVAGAVIRAF